jgi:hypothetical protein
MQLFLWNQRNEIRRDVWIEGLNSRHQRTRDFLANPPEQFGVFNFG